MKTLIKSLLVLAATIMFAACEDVPAPYPTPNTGGEQGGTTTEEVAEGDGTLANPYNPAAINAYIATLAADVESETNVYVKGTICSIKENSNTQYGNASFYISADGKSSSTQFYVYRCYGPDNKKFTQDNMLNVGDEVIICGKVVNYKGNTPETVQNKAYIYSLNGNGGGSEMPEINGENLLANGDFEAWDGSQPTNWKSASTASNATLSQSTDAHGGSYSVAIAGATANKRLAYKELTLKSGTYAFSFYAKATATDKCQCRPGYVPVTNGAVGDYSYGSYEGIKTSQWTKVEYQFTLEAQTVVSLVIMNPKGGTDYQDQQDILIDDAALMTNDGGIVEGGNDTPDTPNPPTPGDVEHITIADFLAKADASTTYELTGTVKNITNTQYGNFDLVDETGTIFIYGLLDLEGNAKNFESIGIKEGDEVTLTGVYKDYNGKAEIANAQLISFKKGEGGNGGYDKPDTPNVEPEGDNLLGNGDFEVWDGNTPVNWKSASTASNATLKQSTDAHTGSYSVAVVGASSNKRLAYKEITLSAGNYTFSFYAKATSTDKCQCRPGYVPITDGSVGNYAYGEYSSIKTGTWTLITHDFTLEAETTVCLVVMNPKGGTDYQDQQDILIDDASLIKK